MIPALFHANFSDGQRETRIRDIVCSATNRASVTPKNDGNTVPATPLFS